MEIEAVYGELSCSISDNIVSRYWQSGQSIIVSNEYPNGTITLSDIQDLEITDFSVAILLFLINTGLFDLSDILFTSCVTLANYIVAIFIVIGLYMYNKVDTNINIYLIIVYIGMLQMILVFAYFASVKYEAESLFCIPFDSGQTLRDYLVIAFAQLPMFIVFIT